MSPPGSPGHLAAATPSTRVYTWPPCVPNCPALIASNEFIRERQRGGFHMHEKIRLNGRNEKSHLRALEKLKTPLKVPRRGRGTSEPPRTGPGGHRAGSGGQRRDKAGAKLGRGPSSTATGEGTGGLRRIEAGSRGAISPRTNLSGQGQSRPARSTTRWDPQPRSWGANGLKMGLKVKKKKGWWRASREQSGDPFNEIIINGSNSGNKRLRHKIF